ncbi:nitroreductase family protein [Desulfovibrio psychrotolerans]|uniref:Nitroreductase family protein n=1 Tax=Desulfovibrio psychrotolerans TaxID=415242 RepID=A0A7J0BU81_9BACT|nr:nitroreductase family protein [Desulfovibrio psychrotolerans]GFM37269.1 nitroreductase family protein [Desulfovibrio psychrotolerans]
METLQAIHTRRSIRRYAPGKVGRDVVEELLRAGMAAPSAGNQQPWRFVVIEDRAVLERIPAIHPYAVMASKASCAIMVCGDPTAEKYPGNWMLDCSAAIQNILLALHDKGLGGVWCGLWPVEERVEAFRELVGVPEHIIPLALIPVGVPDQNAGPQDRYDAAKIHWNRW